MLPMLSGDCERTVQRPGGLGPAGDTGDSVPLVQSHTIMGSYGTAHQRFPRPWVACFTNALASETIPGIASGCGGKTWVVGPGRHGLQQGDSCEDGGCRPRAH